MSGLKEHTRTDGQDLYSNRPGYFTLKEYLSSFDDFEKSKTWKLPLTIYDRLQLNILKLANKLVKNLVYIEHPFMWSPPYSVLINYFKKNEILDSINSHRSWIDDYYIFVATKTKYNPLLVKNIKGLGVDTSISKAVSKCLGELIEREISHDLAKVKICRTSSYNDLVSESANSLFPALHHKFSQESANRNITEKDSIEWTEGTSIIENKKILIPKQLISWGGPQPKTGKSFYHHSSNGVAAYFNKEKALYSALTELIQRDAFLVHWLTFTSPRQINKGTLPEHFAPRLRKIEDLGIEVYILDITTDIKIPSICTVLVTKKERSITLSASTDVAAEEAISKSLEEAVMCIDNLTRESSDILPKEPTIYKNLDGNLVQRNRNHLWRGAEWFNAFKWFIEGDLIAYEDLLSYPQQRNPSLKEKLSRTLHELEMKGVDYHPCFYEYKHNLLDKTGFYVVRALIPKIFPFYLSEEQSPFDSERLVEFAKLKGRNGFTLNKFPHMFP